MPVASGPLTIGSPGSQSLFVLFQMGMWPLFGLVADHARPWMRLEFKTPAPVKSSVAPLPTCIVAVVFVAEVMASKPVPPPPPPAAVRVSV